MLEFMKMKITGKHGKTYFCEYVFMTRTEDRMATRAASAITKSMSDPIHLSPSKHDQSNGRASPMPAASTLSVLSPNESELIKLPSTEHKKKTGFSKLLPSSKQKTP